MVTTESVQSRFDAVKTLLAAALLVVGIIGYHYYEAQYEFIYRLLALLGVVGIALIIAAQTLWGKMLWSYLLDARNELRKVVWPTRAETTQTTVIVAVVVVLVGLFLWLMDLFFGWLIHLLLSL